MVERAETRLWSEDGDRYWKPQGSAVTLAGLTLPDGMIYFGTALRSLGGYFPEPEPALIDPQLGFDLRCPDTRGEGMVYWPSYSRIPPAARAAYLKWLAAGRSDPTAYIGYVFLFFYGIERRVLVDSQRSSVARTEVGDLLLEVERLLGIYSSNASFRAYASQFLEVARLKFFPPPLEELEPPKERITFGEPPLSIKLALGAFVSKSQPVPAEWAFAWWLTCPDVSLRTPAQRCPVEFRELFIHRFEQKFRQGGLKVRPNKTRIEGSYRPASPSFTSPVLFRLPDLPDVTRLSGPIGKLQEIAAEVAQQLDAYSRWVGRTGDTSSLVALGLLPPELVAHRETPESQKLVGWIERQLSGAAWAAIRRDDLLALWPAKTPGKLLKHEAQTLAAFLAQRRYGIEPDLREGASLLMRSELAVLFRLEDGMSAETAEPSLVYRAATVLMHLAAAVSAADGAISAGERAHLARHLEQGLHLTPPERRRLEAHLEWLLQAPPRLGGLAQRLAVLSAGQRQALGPFLISVAGADGQISPAELKLLEKVYPLLGLDPNGLYSDIHTLLSTSVPAAEPVTVKPRETGAPGFALPRPPAARGIVLDTKKLADIITGTESVVGVLDRLLNPGEEPALSEIPAAETEGERIAGLDVGHSLFLRRLGEKDQWQRTEIEQLAAELALLPEGALEMVNEAACNVAGTPVIEGDELLDLDRTTFEEMLR
ncbi:MAG: hypothetical protein HC897_05770 [Thermoanaerobaculia bacterium]|nr:hypothetical protein [Thermoanaerobaculia bacterium]